MKINIATIISSASLVTAFCAHGEGMCNEGEAKMFNCEMKNSISSMCMSKDANIIFYRNGHANKINLEISENSIRKEEIFYLSSVPYSGGGETHIQFSRQGYTYYIYDKTIKTDDGTEFSAGIVIYKGSVRIFDQLCENDASIYQNAYSNITKESYQDIDSK